MEVSLGKPLRERQREKERGLGEREGGGTASVIIWLSGPPIHKASDSPSMFQLYLPTNSIFV